MVYRCKHSSCRKRITLLSNTIFKNSKIELKDLLFMVFSFLLNIRTNTVFNLLNYSENTYSFFKDRMIPILEEIYNSKYEKIGGYGRSMQIDEMGFRRGKLVRNPTSENDNYMVWIVGAIEEQTLEEIERKERLKFFVTIVQNRRTENIKNVFNTFIAHGTHIKSDGYPSYPPSIASANQEFGINFTHEVVNYSEGFTNVAGTHTNTIEGFWAHLRNFCRERHGITRNRLEGFWLSSNFLNFLLIERIGIWFKLYL